MCQTYMRKNIFYFSIIRIVYTGIPYSFLKVFVTILHKKNTQEPLRCVTSGVQQHHQTPIFYPSSLSLFSDWHGSTSYMQTW